MFTKDNLKIENDIVYIGSLAIALLDCDDGRYSITYFKEEGYGMSSEDDCLEEIIKRLNSKD